MSDNDLTQEEIIERFGFDPREVGNRHRGSWILDRLTEEAEMAGAREGDVCVEARDGGFNEPDMRAATYGRFVGTAQDMFDVTYRYYYYRPLDAEEDGS